MFFVSTVHRTGRTSPQVKVDSLKLPNISLAPLMMKKQKRFKKLKRMKKPKGFKKLKTKTI
jgi:hypothetical protein